MMKECEGLCDGLGCGGGEQSLERSPRAGADSFCIFDCDSALLNHVVAEK